MAGSLAAVPEEESMDVSTAAYLPRSPYRDMIRRVAVSGTQIRFSHSQSGHSGGSSYSSDSGTSNSYPSNNSGCSSRSASAAAADFGIQELTEVARRMVSDGYTQRMVQAFSDASPHFDMMPAWPTHVCSEDQDRVLETWFLELDVGWVLQIRQEHDSQWQRRLQHNSGLSLEDLVERWIRGLTVIVLSIAELQYTSSNEIMAVRRFCEASIWKMHIFVDAMVPAWKAENLRSVLDMYICARKAMDIMEISWVYPLAYKLKNAISSTMEKVRTLVENDDSWAIEIPRGGGEVHRNTRWIADCILALGEAAGANTNPLLSETSASVSIVRHDTIGYLKGLLERKSDLYSDPSLGYLFLLNNFYFVAQICELEHSGELKHRCEMYMDSYLDVSWGHVLSCIPKSHFPGTLYRLMNISTLVKFESAFNETYQAQKFWKVPDPRLRDELRRAITKRVVPTYRQYLKGHPELAEHVSRKSTTPNILEEMLGQIFEG